MNERLLHFAWQPVEELEVKCRLLTHTGHRILADPIQKQAAIRVSQDVEFPHVMKLRKWLSDLWVRSDRFDLQNVNLAPDIGNVRQYSPRDHESCLAIFESNDGDHLREESEEDFRNFLLNDSVLKLVVEKDGQVSGVGGVCISSKETEGAWLSFGMVHADLQNQGVGTKLLLSRLALLPQPDAYWQILMTSLEASVDFYKRFGFEYFGQFPSDDGKSTVDVYYSILTKNAMASVRSWFMQSMHGRDLDSISVPRWP